MRFLDLSISGKGVVSFRPWALYSLAKSPWYPLDRKLGGPYLAYLNELEKRKFLTLPGLKLQALVVQPVVSHYTDCATTAL
jgi:hypothetical protein